MKFEIDPNELTTDQRAYVAEFITNWPHADEVDHAGEAELRRHARIYGDVTEEQRLDAEQKEDLGPIGDADLKNLVDIPEANLTAIFGEPKSSAVPLDSQGLPWDSRIHSSSKATIADGSWKLRRGVDPAEVEKVKAQLRELMAVPTVREVPPDGTGYVHLHPNAVITPIAPAPVLTATPVVTIGSASHVPVPPSPKSIDQAPAVTLTDLIGRMSKAIAENRLTQAAVKEMCVKHGVSEFHLLGNRPDLLPLIDADMKAMGV